MFKKVRRTFIALALVAASSVAAKVAYATDSGGGNCTSGVSITPSSIQGVGSVGSPMNLSGPIPNGFSGAVTYSVAGVPLPAGLNLNSVTGVVGGIPQASSFANVIINVAFVDQSCQFAIGFSITPGGSMPQMPTCTTGTPSLTGSNPTVDPLFGTGGAIAFTDVSGDTLGGGVATADGNLVIAEAVSVTSNPVIKIRKYTPAGILVSSFGSSGVFTIDKASGTDNESANEISELSDGSLVLVYAVRPFTGNGSTLNYLVKVTSLGAIDTSFGNEGFVAINNSNTSGDARNLSVLSDDSMIVSFSQMGSGTGSNTLLKFSSTGAVDSTFGTSGVVSLTSSPQDIAVNTAGEVFITAVTANIPTSSIVKKYSSVGALDTTWATSGILTPPSFGNQGDSLMIGALTIDANNKLYVAIQASTMQSITATSKLFRFLANGTIDTSFGSGTLLSTDLKPYVFEILILADGNVLLNSMNMGMMPQAGVSVVSSSGVLDSSYVTNTAVLQFGDCALTDMGLAQLKNGEIMAFGSTYAFGPGAASTGSLWKLNFSGVTGGSGEESTTTTPSSSATTTTSTTVPPPAESVVVGLPRAGTPLVVDDSYAPGDDVTLTFSGFEAGEFVQLIVASTPQVISSGYANSQGVVTLSGKMPADLVAGNHTLAVYAPGRGVGFSQPITVTALLLPATGWSGSGLLYGWAMLLILLGVMWRFVGRRRTRA